MKQILPLFLATLTFLILCLLLFVFIHLLNLFPIHQKIVPGILITDIFVGFFIYVKTSVDFALFIGNLMSKYRGTKNRIAIDIGTAFGNGIGTFVILAIWTFLKEAPLLLGVMIFIAAVILLSMAEEGVEKYQISNIKYPIPNFWNNILLTSIYYLGFSLQKINMFFSPITKLLIPTRSSETKQHEKLLSLFIFSITIPLILGLDDFAGYIPLFTLVNVFGFAIGVFLGHLLLTNALFAFPNVTIRIVKQPLISLLGSLAFIAIAIWGFVEILLLIA